MSSKVFQSVILQIKDATERTVGIVNSDGTVVAATDMTLAGANIGCPADFPDNETDGAITVSDDNYTYKLLENGTAGNYMVFAGGNDELAKTVCLMAAIAVNETGINLEESFDKLSFIKTVITENILTGDIFARAKELRFAADSIRGVFVIRLSNAPNTAAIDLVQATFPDRLNDYVFALGNTDIAVIKEMPPEAELSHLISLAEIVSKKIQSQLGLESVIGIGAFATHLRELAGCYKQALIAIDVGRVFETGNTIISYEKLGISRLIYQLPTTLCEMFLSEVFKLNPIEVLDQETLSTIDTFFENSLNVSETARKLFIHRNTLVYRLDKIEKVTGLDLREFDNAIVFKVALMVKKYLTSQEHR